MAQRVSDVDCGAGAVAAIAAERPAVLGAVCDRLHTVAAVEGAQGEQIVGAVVKPRRGVRGRVGDRRQALGSRQPGLVGQLERPLIGLLIGLGDG